MTNQLVYSTDSYEHECNINGITPSDVNHEDELRLSDIVSLEDICVCGRFEIYSKTLTNGLCLNCYHQLQEEERMVEIECMHDYESGLI